MPRNGLLWNATDQTDTFTPDAGPMANVVWLFDFEKLPESARRYITVIAVTKFQTDQLGSDANYKYTKDDERFALSILLDEERLYEPRGNMFNDSQDVQEVWQR